MATDIETLAASIYASAVAQTPWAGALDDIAGALGADGARLVIVRDSGAAPQRFARGAEVEDAPHASGPEGRVIELTGAYLEGHVAASGGARATLLLRRNPGAGAFSQAETKLCQRLLPHLRGALDIYLRVSLQAENARAQAELLDLFCVGLAALDARGRVLDLNAEARRMIAAHDGINLIDDRLVFADARTGAQLRALLDARPCDGPQTAILSAERPSGAPGLGLLVRLAPDDGDPSRHRAATIIITDPLRSPTPEPSRVARLFGLTPTEAALAVLLSEGLALEESGERLGMRRNTARAHLRSIFAKTGMTRQAELVRYIYASVASLGALGEGGGAPH